MPTAILSVADKTGLVEFAGRLVQLGWKLLATAGTARLLADAGLPVTEVAEYTGSPEILAGRVKTLHPAVHAGLLARSTPDDLQELNNLGWRPIDMAVINLYPFEEVTRRPGTSLADAIENIDIGGVAMLRAAAKNYERVTVLCSPQDYPLCLEALNLGELSLEERRRLAVKAFLHTTQYDAAIAGYLGEQEGLLLRLFPVQQLRYGENPHQTAALFSYQPGVGPLDGELLQGKELSYNNLLDLDAAWRTALSFARPTIAIVKHLSPCGIASSDDLSEAYRLAYECDPLSAFGGVIAANRPFDTATAESLGSLFVECIIAPAFTPEARQVLSRKKNCRLLESPAMRISPAFEFRSVSAGLLRQAIDFGDPAEAEWKVVSKRQPTSQEWHALRFAWKACQHIKSNAIVFAQGEATVGIGGGQPNRVDCVRMAAQRAAAKSVGAVMASDAFFPFTDSIQVAAQAGVTAIIQPGGSIRDNDCLAAVDELGLAMVFTGVRHFRH